MDESRSPLPHETEPERIDRNWNEILQELRVTQTGTQIFAGFLLTLAFQPRFAELDAFDRYLYLGVLIAAIASTVLALAPVSMHRALFRQRAKPMIVRFANFALKTVLALISLVLIGTVLLVVDLVTNRTAAMIAAGGMLLLVLVAWLLLPWITRLRRAQRD
ncbi:DUF6328 family protein [Ruicaihuangia caeni]|uniref:DUF6328 family protein n=1 Tax=Ruicaihuangia caeni TaxID=3042517 RepID=A0AAW6T793_9MICO|nr:DUF6328 family protein [Klugiella sp. YN-L-19]MDI2099696.1 DUF6328 family protein [Klugiella sp. YN-L-19]